MNQFFEKNKVFLVGLFSAVLLAIQPYMGGGVKLDFKVVGLAAGIAILSYLAKEWRGQGMTILGIIGVVAGTVVALYENGSLSWQQLIFEVAFALVFSAMPDPKSRGYEQSSIIKEAKKEGETIVPAKLTVKP